LSVGERKSEPQNITPTPCTLEALAESIEADASVVKAVMYRDAYGNTWDGQGDKPAWLARAIYAGQNIDHFRC
jgi:DNA-binding protein H-NS